MKYFLIVIAFARYRDMAKCARIVYARRCYYTHMVEEDIQHTRTLNEDWIFIVIPVNKAIHLLLRSGDYVHGVTVGSRHRPPSLVYTRHQRAHYIRQKDANMVAVSSYKNIVTYLTIIIKWFMCLYYVLPYCILYSIALYVWLFMCWSFLLQNWFRICDTLEMLCYIARRSVPL